MWGTTWALHRVEYTMESVSRLFGKFVLVTLFLGSNPGCGGSPEPKSEVRHPLLSLPHSVAILMAEEKDFLFNNESLLNQAYDRLESETWHVLSEQAGVQVLERRNLDVVRQEQYRQQLYAMDEETAVRIGRLVGAKGVMFYQIRMPSWRDRFIVEEELLPITLGGRLLEVETGTVLWSQTVTVSPSDCPSSRCWWGGKPQATLWPTLKEGIDQLVDDLSNVVPCHHVC